MRKQRWAVAAAGLYIFTVGALALVVHTPGNRPQTIGLVMVTVSLLTAIVVAVPAAAAGYRYGARRAFRQALEADRDGELARLIAKALGRPHRSRRPGKLKSVRGQHAPPR